MVTASPCQNQRSCRKAMRVHKRWAERTGQQLLALLLRQSHLTWPKRRRLPGCCAIVTANSTVPAKASQYPLQRQRLLRPPGTSQIDAKVSGRNPELSLLRARRQDVAQEVPNAALSSIRIPLQRHGGSHKLGAMVQSTVLSMPKTVVTSAA